ncbi:MAG: hypothetical protein A3G21_15400 [Acidobacteria bacterium RIFCSPLOWO2_12_FULL_66_21]|nr:MAG: hypothetical protein A3G21_15400 [Acidobacteria bacterium RIFCSPLOWO2_12_FULL_66_21]
MKKSFIAVLCLVVLAGAGFGAYRLGLLDRFTGTTTTGQLQSNVATSSSPTPGAVAGSTPSAATGAPSAPVTDAAVPAAATTAAPPGATTDAASPVAASAPAPTAAATPIPPGLVAVAQAGQPIANKAVEVRVSSHRTAASIGSQNAGPGREFVIVESSWQNIIPKVKVNRKKMQDRTGGMGSLGFGGGTTAKDKTEDEANTTLESMAFEVSQLPTHLWLVADGRSAEAIDAAGTQALEAHLSPTKLTIAEFQQVISGGLAFQAPANAQSLALLFLDTINGHLLLPIKGTPPVLASSLGGSGRANTLVDLALTGASWSDAPPSESGTRTLVVGLRGISRQNAIVAVPFGKYAFLQTEQGCLFQPDAAATGLTRQLAPVGQFLPFVPSEGQLAFTVPADTKTAALLVRLQQGGPIDLAVMGTVTPAWPSPEATVKDGDVLRVLKLPGTAVPPGVPAAPSGSERVALDLVVENLRSGAGIELQPQQQFRLVGPDGTRYEPSSDSAHVPCRLTGDVVPAGSARRFTLIFDMPPGQPLQFEYRGFNVKSELVKVR